MNRVGPTETSSTTHYSQNQSLSGEVYHQVSSTQTSADQLTSHSAQSDMKIAGLELVAKSAVAVTLGIVPFIVTKFGEFVVKGCVYLVERTENLFGERRILAIPDSAIDLDFMPRIFSCDKAWSSKPSSCQLARANAQSDGKRRAQKIQVYGRVRYNVSRMAIGIPAFLGGIFLFGGAVVFARTQQVVWGKYLVEHPQEERINTQLARYGCGSKPWNDFCKLLTNFFTPSFGLESVD